MRHDSRLLSLVLAAILAVTLQAAAYPRDDAAVVEIDVHSRAEIHHLNELGMDIMNVRDGVAEIAAVPSEIDVLRANGYIPRIVMERMIDGVASLRLEDRGEYHSYTELTNDMAAWASAYPNITELVSIGQSVLGRELWAMKITDNPAIEEFEPEIQWIGAHHGDETISVEVCYYMIDHLLENYGTDPQVTWLVDEREIWIIPMFNPDGHTSGSRYNGNGEDLNRGYLCPCGCNAGSAMAQPEHQALEAFNERMNPVTSLTFHSGAVYVNYLWDYTYSATPDEAMLITLSEGYSSYTGLPVTNGADWYIVHGSCQDWCYDQRGEIDTTIEVSTTKDPPQSSIDPIVSDNIPAMLYQARKSGKGIRGLVTDGETGEPLYATISIPEIGKDVYTDPDVGDYHRMVESGTYTVVCEVEGYPTETVYNVSANLDTFVVVNFAMEPPPRGTVAGYVTDELMNPIEATVEVTDLTGYSASSDPATGYYEIPYIPAGTHTVRASAPGFRTEERTGVEVVDNTTSTESFALVAPVFYDDFESGLSGWNGSWATTTSEAMSPTHSMTDSPGGQYGNNDYTVTTLASPVDLTGHAEAALVFWHRYDTEAGYDICYVEVSSDGGSSWTQVGSYDGLQNDWVEEEIDVSSWAGTSQFLVRFTLDSDGWITDDGWYVDDVQVFGDQTLSGIDEEIVRAPRVANYPNPFNPVTSVTYSVPSPGSVTLGIYDVSGRLVRTLVDGAVEVAGEHSATWNGTDEGGRSVAGGVYFARLVTDAGEASSKLVLLK
ncbi:MAG: T9SS type A sorting domain-containing protein [Candidatus Eisenbacteria bacterium]|nr:T9SS type A sorting domain-containing protein [Candidatus Eisenbacteria bacterium]